MLIIDSRENSELANRIIAECNRIGVLTEKKWIEVGDYVIDEVCFEAKSSFDFLQSVMNKRIWQQIDNMDRNFENANVIIYGDVDEAIHDFRTRVKMANAQWNYAHLHNRYYSAIAKIILDTDCNVIITDTANLASKIVSAVAKMKPMDRKIYDPRLIKQKTIRTSDLRIDVLMTIKGISEKKAKLLIQEFGSIMEIGEATVGELCKLEGIGETLATRIVKVLNSENKQVI
tara:strand:+ start:1035 stop:1727 length:693 start_codon:yes stop_codon:yes gene_type:complete